MPKENLEFVKEGPYGYLIEPKLIKIAAIKASKCHPGTYRTASNHPLLECVALNPAYIPEGFTDYEVLEVRSRRLSRRD